jgi:hypothetical protein
MVVSSTVGLRGDLDEVGIMGKHYGCQLSRVRQLILVDKPYLALIINGHGLDSPAAQSFSDTDVDILIGVNF